MTRPEREEEGEKGRERGRNNTKEKRITFDLASEVVVDDSGVALAGHTPGLMDIRVWACPQLSLVLVSWGLSDRWLPIETPIAVANDSQAAKLLDPVH